MAKKMITMKFEPEFLAEIDAAATRRGIDRTAFVEKALRRVLAGESGVPDTRGGPGRPLNAPVPPRSAVKPAAPPPARREPEGGYGSMLKKGR